MDPLCIVSIHRIDPTGTLAGAEGTGSLVHPLVVLVHPPLDQRLLQDVDPRRWRVVAEVDGAVVGLLMIIVPSWTDAGESTDLAVDRAARGSGEGPARH